MSLFEWSDKKVAQHNWGNRGNIITNITDSKKLHGYSEQDFFDILVNSFLLQCINTSS
eukprot:m.209652 g.209652  ORF g.209652 m.209652 type:complete len:58 (-) comp15817_c0_seq4:225-398(-)